MPAHLSLLMRRIGREIRLPLVARRERRRDALGLPVIDPGTQRVIDEGIAYAAYFASQGHKPLLLMDGARESPADRRYLEDFYREMADPKRYVTVPNADHYANTTEIHAVTVYDRQVLTHTLDAIDSFLRE